MSYIHWGNLCTLRKPPPCRYSLINFSTYCCIEYTLLWVGFELTILVVIGTDCICSCKSNYQTITTTTTPTKTIEARNILKSKEDNISISNVKNMSCCLYIKSWKDHLYVHLTQWSDLPCQIFVFLQYTNTLDYMINTDCLLILLVQFFSFIVTVHHSEREYGNTVYI